MKPGTEKWLPVVGYEGYYEVSDHGSVRSLDRVITTARRTFLRRGSLVALQVTRKNYRRVCLCKDGVERCFPVHRLVLLAFIGPCPDGMECCHNDGDPSNNCLTNLRWDTSKGNNADQIKHGTRIKAFTHHQSKFGELAPLVRELRKLGATYNQIAKEIGASSPTVRDIVSGKSWSNVPDNEQSKIEAKAIVKKIGAPERKAKGEKHWSSKLTSAIVLQLRGSNLVTTRDYKRAANKYKVSEDAIRFAVTGKTWQHLPFPETIIRTTKGEA